MPCRTSPLQNRESSKPCNLKTLKLRADTPRARLPRPPRSNPCHVSQHPCCVQSNRPRVREVLLLSAAQSRGPHRLSWKETRVCLLRISEQTKSPPARPRRDRRGNM